MPGQELGIGQEILVQIVQSTRFTMKHSIKSAGALALSTFLTLSNAWQHGGPHGPPPPYSTYSFSYPSFGHPTPTTPSIAPTSATSHAVTTTFSIPTASNANPTASVPTVDDGMETISYSTVPGYFLQDLNTTNPSTFDFVWCLTSCYLH